MTEVLSSPEGSISPAVMHEVFAKKGITSPNTYNEDNSPINDKNRIFKKEYLLNSGNTI